VVLLRPDALLARRRRRGLVQQVTTSCWTGVKESMHDGLFRIF